MAPREISPDAWPFPPANMLFALAAIHMGAVARPLGAGFVFVLILLLAKIPFAIVAAGSRLILAVAGRKGGAD